MPMADYLLDVPMPIVLDRHLPALAQLVTIDSLIIAGFVTRAFPRHANDSATVSIQHRKSCVAPS